MNFGEFGGEGGSAKTESLAFCCENDGIGVSVGDSEELVRGNVGFASAKR